MTSLIVNPHPLTQQGRRIEGAQLVPGETLAVFLHRAGVDLQIGGWSVSIGGVDVPELMWARTRPKHGHIIECTRRPGRDVVRIVALAALAYWTFGAGATGTWAAGGGFGTFLLQTGAYMAGAMIINRVLAPPRERLPTYDNATGSTYALAGGRNRARPYEPLGLLFGKTKVIPDYASQPYSWYQGDNQIQALRFSGGLNIAGVESLLIGQTPIESFDDVVISRAGFPAGNSEYLDWANVDSVTGALLTAPTGTGAWVARTTSPDTLRAELDFVASLYLMADSGAMSLVTLTVNLQSRLLPSGPWVNEPNVVFASTSTNPARRSLVINFPTAGTYEIQARKLTADIATTRQANSVEWVSLKSFQEEVTNYDGYPQVGLRIRASGQINGVVDELSWVGTAQSTDVWTGSAYVVQPTSNPGAQMLQFARGIKDPSGRRQAGMGYSDAQIDLESLQSFTSRCAAMGYTFDHWFDRPLSCLDTLEAMAAVGLGSVSHHSGKLGVVWLSPGQPIEAVVNMANIKSGTFRVDYATREFADELEVSYFDSTDGYKPKSLRLLAPGVSVPRETARLAPAGIHTEAAAVRMGRVAMAQNIYQRKAVTWEMDLEYKTFRRYSLIALSHDLTRWGYSGRLAAASQVGSVVTLALDDAVPANGVRYVGLRIPGETGYRVFSVQAFSGEAHTITLNGTWPVGVPFPGDSASNPAHDTIWIYDFKAEPGQRLRVTNVEPTADMKGARVTASPEPDAFWDYMATGAYSTPPAPAAAAPITLANLRVAQRRLDVNYGNDTELTLTFDVAGPLGSVQVYGAPDGNARQLLGSTMVPRFGPILVGNDGVYVIELRAFDQLGRLADSLSVAYSVALGAILGGGGVQLLTLLTTAQAFTFDSSGAAVPSAQNVTFTAQTANLTGTPTFACTLYDASNASLGAGTLTGSGGSRVLSVAAFGAAAYAVVMASLGGFGDQVTVVRLRDGTGGVNGQDAINAILTNEAHTVATAEDGSGGSYGTAGGTLKLYKGTTLLTSGVTFSVVSSSGISGLAIDAAGVYTLTGTTADQGAARLRATYAGVNYDKDYGISRSRQGSGGAPGAAAKLLILLSSAQAFTFDAAGAAAPSGQSIGFTAQLSNITGTATFTCTLFNSAGGVLGSGTLGGSGNTRTLAVGDFGAANYAIVAASLAGFADQVTVVRLRDGAGGAPGQDAVQVLLTNEAHTVATASDGSGGDYTTAGGTMRAYRGATLLTSGVAFSVVSSSGISGLAIDAAGVYTLTGTTANQGTARLRATYAGVDYDKDYGISRSRQGSDGLPGAAAQLLSLLSSAQAFTFDSAGAAAPTGQSIAFTAQLANISGTATFTCTLFNGSGSVIGSGSLGGSGNTRTLAVADFGAASYAVVAAGLGVLTDQVTVVRLRDGTGGVNGQDAIQVLLTNEAHTVATASDGSGGDYTTAGGTMLVYRGTTLLTSGVTFSVVSSSGISGMAIDAAGVYTLTGTTANQGGARLRATYAGGNYDKDYGISRSRQGLDGAPAQSLALRASAAAFTFDTAGGQTPTGQSISLTAQLSNLSGTATFTANGYTAVGGSLGALTLGGSGNTRTLSATAFGSSAYAVVQASLGGFTDQVTINRVITGPPTSGIVTDIGQLGVYFDDVYTNTPGVRMRVRRDGSIEQKTGSGGSGTWTPIAGWYLGGGSTIGDSFQARVTKTGSNLQSGTLNSWLHISTDLEYALQINSIGSRDALLSVQIQPYGGGAVVSSFLLQLSVEGT